jgi:hypothetical protein
MEGSRVGYSPVKELEADFLHPPQSPTHLESMRLSKMSYPGGPEAMSKEKTVVSARMYRICSLLESHPVAVPDDDLLSLSLSTFNKNCKGSSQETMSTFLRWLEVHRQNPSKFTPVWSDIILQWSQSLRSRGFRESEVVYEMKKWKEANEPFRPFTRRYPPMPADIERAYRDEPTSLKARDKMRERDRMGDSYRPSDPLKEETKYDYYRPSEKKQPFNFVGPPPLNYVCNRCGRKG